MRNRLSLRKLAAAPAGIRDALALWVNEAGEVRTVDEDGTDAALGGGGSQPGALIAVIREFTETAGAGTYTATVDLPADARLAGFQWRTEVTWADDAMHLAVSDESGSLFEDDTGTSPDPLSIWLAVEEGVETWATSSPSRMIGKSYPAGQTLTVVVTTADPSGTTGRGSFIALYYADPDTANAVKS